MSSVEEDARSAIETLRYSLPAIRDSETLASIASELSALHEEYSSAVEEKRDAETPSATTVVNASDGAPVLDAEVDSMQHTKSDANRRKRAAQKARKKVAAVGPDADACSTASAEAIAPASAPDEDSIGDHIELPPKVRGAVRVFHGSRGRGLQCTRRVEKGEVLIGIPKGWALSASKTGGSSGQVALALELVALRRKGDFRVSQLAPANDMPCHWSAEEIAWLKSSYVHEPARNQRPTLEAMHAQVAPPNCTAAEFVWAMSMVQSRTFGGDGTMVFLPFIDMINSESAPDLRFDLRRADGYINVCATRAFDEGEEALVSYHDLKHPELYSNFLAYGFVPAAVEYPTLVRL